MIIKPLIQNSQNPKIEGVEVEKLKGLEVEKFCSSEDQHSRSSSRVRENLSRSVDRRPESIMWENLPLRRIVRVGEL